MSAFVTPELHVLIVEDEGPARRRLCRMVREAPDAAVVGDAGDAAEAVRLAEALRPDLLLLDVHLGDATGFDVLLRCRARLGDALPLTVFVTAFDRYAQRAFDVAAVDYLLKPVERARLRRALGRARRRLQDREASAYARRLFDLASQRALDSTGPVSSTTADAPDLPAPDRGPVPSDRLVVKSGSDLHFLDPAQIDRVEAEGVYVRVHVGDASYLLRESLSNVEARLDARRFMRVHRSTVVNVERVRKIVPHFNGGAIVVLQDGGQVKMSRSYRARLTAALG